MDSFDWPYFVHWLMSQIWLVSTVHIPDINFWCLEQGEVFCPYSRHHCPSWHHCPCSRHHCPYWGHHCPYSRRQFCEKSDVLNIASQNFPYSRQQCPYAGCHNPYSRSHCSYSLYQFHWKLVVRQLASESCPYPGHQLLMSGIRKKKLSIFQASTFDVWNMDSKKSDVWMYGIWTMMSRTWTVISGIWTVKFGIWMENIYDVGNMVIFFTVHTPDVNFWYPEYGQSKLSIFRTSTFEVPNILAPK